MKLKTIQGFNDTVAAHDFRGEIETRVLGAKDSLSFQAPANTTAAKPSPFKLG